MDTMPYPGSFSDKVELPLQSSESSRAALIRRWRGSKAADSPTVDDERGHMQSGLHVQSCHRHRFFITFLMTCDG